MDGGDEIRDGQAPQAPGGAGAPGATALEAELEAAIAARDERIAELEEGIAEAARTAEGAERLRAEMDELRRAGDEQRIGFELQLAGARSVKAARALLDDHGGDVESLKAAEPWLFGAGAPAGATGLPAAGAADDAGTQMRRWREIAGLDGDEE